MFCPEVVSVRVSCRYCGGTHPAGVTCPKKPQGYHPKGEPTRADRFRRTRKWQAMREQILDRDFHLCRVCFEGNRGTFPAGRLQVHHIVPLVEDYSLRLEESNLISLCPLHHRDAEDGTISRAELRALAEHPPRWSAKL